MIVTELDRCKEAIRNGKLKLSKENITIENIKEHTGLGLLDAKKLLKFVLGETYEQ